MKMSNFKKWLAIAIVGVLTIGSLSLLTACNSGAAISVDADGNYSFKEIENAARYVIEIYNADDVDITTGTVKDDAKYVTRKSFSPSADKSGTSNSFASIPFGTYVPIIYGIYSDRKTTTDFIIGEDYIKGGTLSAPDIMVTNQGLGAIVRIKQNSMAIYTSAEAIYTFTSEIYSDPECTNLVTEINFGEKAEVANNSFYRFHTAEFDVDAEGTYYVRTKADGNEEMQVEDSPWSDVVEITLNADVDDTFSVDATIPVSGDNYDVSGLSFDFIYDLMWHKGFVNGTMNDLQEGEILDFTCGTVGGMMAETTVFHLLEDGTLYIEGPSQIPVDLVCYTGTWTKNSDGSISMHIDSTDYGTAGEDELAKGSGVKGALTISEGWGS